MLKILSLFSGIGAFEKALHNLEIPFELIGFSEIDKYAVKSYCAIHNVDESKNLGDVSKINVEELPKDIDLITYGFPCQDISLAGKQTGLFNEDGTQTRSGLFFEALRIIEATKPRIAIAENVKNLTSKKFGEQFEIVLNSLEEAGYNNYFKVLNAKDYGIPQNRERVFIVSIRKDIDTGVFEFPEGFPLELRLKDMLEDEVDEKFYLNNAMIERLYTSTFTQGKFENRVVKEDGVCGTLMARDYKDPKCVQVGQMYGTEKEPINSDVCGTITTGCSRNGSGTFLVREATKKGYAEATDGDSINLEQPNSKTRRDRVGHGVAQTLTTSPQQGVVTSDVVPEDFPLALDEQNKYIRTDGTVGTIMTDGSSPKHNNRVIEVSPTTSHNKPFAVNGTVVYDPNVSLEENRKRNCETMKSLRIRKLTPKECWRLMGFDDSDFEKAEKVNSNTQLYKQAGNSIVVNVIEKLFTELNWWVK